MERARRVLRELRVPHREIDIEADEEAAAKVQRWTGFYSVPTIVVAEGQGLDPALPISPLPEGASPRGVDRGGMITEPRADQLVTFLRRHGFPVRISTNRLRGRCEHHLGPRDLL